MKNYLLLFNLVFLVQSSIAQSEFFYVNSYNETVHLVWDAPVNSHTKMTVERSIDGIKYTTINQTYQTEFKDIASSVNLTDEELYGHFLFSTETGTGRYIYNDRYLYSETGAKRYYRVSISFENSNQLILKADFIELGNALAPYVQGDTRKKNSTSEHATRSVAGGVCPPIMVQPDSSVFTGNIQTHSANCCFWREKEYHSLDTVSLNISPCVNNAPCCQYDCSPTAFDDCCVHLTCSSHSQCACVPWVCCPGGLVDTWIVDSVSTHPTVQFSVSNIVNTCSTDSLGSAEILINSGTAPYHYLWSNGDTLATVNGLPEGTHEVWLTDSNNCGDSVSFYIPAIPYPPDNITIVGDTHLCGNSSVTFVAPSGYTYSWNIGASSQNISVIYAGDYYAIISNDNCSVTSDTISVTSNPIPQVSLNILSDTSFCLNSVLNLIASGGTQYIWNTGATTSSISVAAAGTYSVQSIVNGCSSALQTINLSLYYPAADSICIVSVDSVSNKNIIVWEKTLGERSMTFRIYRETSSTGVFSLIGTIPFDSLSTFIDASSNPDQQSNRYYVSVLDSCNNESGYQAIHRTIHLTANLGINGEINLIWNSYEGFDYPSFNIYRTNSILGTQLISTQPSVNLSFTDLTPPQGINKYFVEVISPNNCIPTRSFTSSISNRIISDNTNSIADLIAKNIRIEKTQNQLSVKWDKIGRFNSAALYNNIGQLVFQNDCTNSSESNFTLLELSAGIYYLTLSGKEIVSEKILKQ